MTPKETALILRLHNAWRRGDDETAPNMTPPKLLGEAIDSAIALIDLHDEILNALKADQYSLQHYQTGLARYANEANKALTIIDAAIAKAKEITS